MEQNHQATQKTARFAGLLYLLLAVTGAYGLMFVQQRTYVRGDPGATASLILQNEFIYRTGIVSNITSTVIFLWMVFVLCKLLKHVHEQQAKLMVALVVVQVPINFVIASFKICSLLLLKGEILKSFTPEQVNDFSMLFTKLAAYGTVAVELFWGLWLIPLAQLVYKSGMLPRFLGVLLLLAGIGYSADSITFMMFPGYRFITFTPALVLSGLGEVGTILWLLIKGVKIPIENAGQPLASSNA